MKKTVILLILMLFPTTVLAAGDILLDQSRWSLEIKGGLFYPELKEFSRYYGKNNVPEYGMSLAYKVLPQLEIGAGAGAMVVKGHALAEFHGTLTGDVTLELYPVNVFAVARGIFYDTQWLVPYVGAGWTRVYYREKIEGQGTVSGFADGYHVRGGLQLSLDSLDPGASGRMYNDYGVIHTSFFMEIEYTRAIVGSPQVNLGGTAYLGGLLFEF